MFVLAHISDPHLGPLPRGRWRELAGKRALGFLNYQLRRRHEHKMEVLDELLADLHAQKPDHIAVTGDLVNLALPDEFPAAAAFLARVGPPDRVSFVPGNHDAYVRAILESSHTHWADYIGADAADVAPGVRFPYVRRRGRVTIFGLSTAVASGAFLAIGRLGLEQLELLERALTERAKHPSFKVVLLHHPPVKVPGDRMKRLVDAEGFRTVLARHQVDLVLHGHIHVGGAHWVPGAARAIPVLSVPSASATEHGEERAAYNLFRIEEAEEGWRCEQIVRGFSARRPGVAELARRILSPRLHEAA